MVSIAPLGSSLDPALPEAKAFLRIDGADEDAVLAAMIASAAALAEGFTGQVLIARAAREAIPADGAWHRLAARPVVSIDGIAVGADAVEPPGTAADISASGDGWIRVLPQADAHAVATVSYHAGLAPDWASLPDPIRQGVLRLTAHLYASRDRADDPGPPAAVAALWRPYRRMRLA